MVDLQQLQDPAFVKQAVLTASILAMSIGFIVRTGSGSKHSASDGDQELMDERPVERQMVIQAEQVRQIRRGWQPTVCRQDGQNWRRTKTARRQLGMHFGTT